MDRKWVAILSTDCPLSAYRGRKRKRRRMGRKEGMKKSEQKNQRIDDVKRAKCNAKE
jgi:hypothetical protein